MENSDYYLKVIFLHQLIHLLGFSATGINAYPKLSYAHSRKMEIFINSQKVIEKAKKYFNCPKLINLTLEVTDYVINKGLHWSTGIMLDDIMINSINYPEVTISEITLAILKESTWYKINYYTEGLMRFGKNKGYEFLYSHCISNGKSNFKNEFYSQNFHELHVQMVD